MTISDTSARFDPAPRVRRGFALGLLAAALAGCGPPSRGGTPADAEVAASRPLVPRPAPAPADGRAPELLAVRVLAEYPHDPEAFTQGLLWHRGALYESVGRYGRSALRQVELESGRVLREAPLRPELFGEGLALAGDRLFQLTWREGRGLVYALSSFATLEEFSYAGEGWGLTFDGRELWMSDGSEFLTRRDARDFTPRGRLRVTRDGLPLANLNELEWVDGSLWANVWGLDDIVRIDPRSGQVTAVAAAAGLLSPAQARGADVLNGIAYDPERRVFLLTGKLWPKLFEVRFAG